MAGGGLGVTIGSTEQKSTFDSQAITQSDARSTVGSIAGNVSITAGKDVHIGGSDVVAGKASDDTTGATGNIRIAGQNVTIDPGRDDLTSHDQEEMRSSGLTVGIRGTPVDMVRNARADLASGNAFGRVNGVMNEVAAFGGGDTPSVSLSYGRSQSTSTTDFSSSTHSGSAIRGGGNVSVIATGGAVRDENGKVLDGDITAIGSTISAGGTTSLHANRDVVLQASTDATQQSAQSSSSSMGFSLAAPTLADMSRWVSGTANKGGASSSPYNASNSSSNGTQAVMQQTASVVSGNSVVVKSDTGNIDVIGSSIAGTQGVDLLAQNGAINVLAGLETNASHQESSSRQIGSLGSNGTSTGFSVGVSKTHMVQDTAAQTQSGVRSAIVSQSGNVTLDAKQDLTVQGSDLAAAGDLTLIGKNLNLDPGTDDQRSSMSQSASQYGVTVS
jgi:filamentous hemagglutinin